MIEAIPEFLKISKEERAAAWRTYTPKGATGASFDWDRYYGPGRACHDRSLPETDEERAIRLAWVRDQETRTTKSYEKAEEKRLDQDDADIKLAVRQHQYKTKLKQKRRRK